MEEKRRRVMQKRKERKRWPLELLQKGPGWPRSWRIVSDRERFGRQMMGGAEGTLFERELVSSGVASHST